MLVKFHHPKDKSLKYLHGEGAASSIENAGISYQSASLLSVGASAKEIALLSTFTNLLFALLLLKVPSFIKTGDYLKRGIILLSFVSCLGWIPLIIIPVFFPGISPGLLIILWVVNLVPELLGGPLRDKWLSDLVPANRIGRYLSLRTILATGTYLTGFYIMGFILDHYQVGIIRGFALIFLLAFLGSLVSLVLYILIKAPVSTDDGSQSGLGMVDFLREARQNDLGIFIYFAALILLSASISGAFFSVYMLQDLHFTYFDFTLVISMEYLARIISSQFWGKLIDNIGAIKVIRIIAFMIPFIPVLWLFSTKLEYLMGIQILSGIAWGAFDLCTQAYLSRAAPEAKRLHYFVYHRSVVTLASAAGSFLGAILLNTVYPVFGNQILGIFLLSGICRMIVVVTLVPRMRRVEEHSSDIENGETIEECEPGSSRIEIRPYSHLDSKVAGGIYHGYQKKGFEITGNPTPEKRSKVEDLVQTGLLYHPELWNQIQKISNIKAASNSKIGRLQDNLTRNIEYHKRWAARVTCS